MRVSPWYDRMYLETSSTAVPGRRVRVGTRLAPHALTSQVGAHQQVWKLAVSTQLAGCVLR